MTQNIIDICTFSAKKMAVFQGKLLLFITLYLAGKTQGQDNFNIVEPYPENIYPIEFTSASVTCVAFDPSGIKTPEKILFMRKNRFAIYTTLTANDNLYFTSGSVLVQVGGKQLKRLFVTLHIRNVTAKDDSSNPQFGRYECHAYAVNDRTVKKHGFIVSVIRRNEIPSVSVTKPSVLQHGDSVTLTCNLTENQYWRGTSLKRISWYKNGVRMSCPHSVRNPDPSNPEDYLEPLVIKNVGAEDGGNYTCLLEVDLRRIKRYDVSDTLTIAVAPWFENPTQVMKIKKSEGDNVSFVCSAKGYPLQVTWKAEKIKDGAVYASTCINNTDRKYQVQRKGVYDPYILTVFNLKYSDAGRYYCCISSQCPSVDSAKDQCQVFNLEVHDRSRNHGAV